MAGCLRRATWQGASEGPVGGDGPCAPRGAGQGIVDLQEESVQLVHSMPPGLTPAGPLLAPLARLQPLQRHAGGGVLALDLRGGGGREGVGAVGGARAGRGRQGAAMPSWLQHSVGVPHKEGRTSP